MGASLTVGEQQVNVTTEAHGSGIAIYIDPERNAPDAYRTTLALFDKATELEGPPEFELKFQFVRGYRSTRAHTGWLRSAYLVAFAAFGYRYILSDKMSLVRRQIADYKTRHIQVSSSTIPGASCNDRHLMLVEEPSWMRGSIAVHMGRHLVFLPGTNMADQEFYELIAVDHETNEDAQVTGKLWPWPAKPQFYFDFRPEFLAGSD